MHCFCHTSNPMRYKNTLNPARLFSLDSSCCLLDTTSTRPASTFSSAAASVSSMPRRRGRSSVILLVSTKRTEDFHSQVNCTSKIVLAKRTSDFHSQVNSRCASKCTSDFHSKSTQTCYPSAHPRTCYRSAWSSSSLSQLTADFVTFGTGSTLWYISFRGAVLSLV